MSSLLNGWLYTNILLQEDFFLVNVWNFPITENSENVGSSEGGRVGLIPCISGINDQNVTEFGLNVHRGVRHTIKQILYQYLLPSL